MFVSLYSGLYTKCTDFYYSFVVSYWDKKFKESWNVAKYILLYYQQLYNDISDDLWQAFR